MQPYKGSTTHDDDGIYFFSTVLYPLRKMESSSDEREEPCYSYTIAEGFYNSLSGISPPPPFQYLCCKHRFARLCQRQAINYSCFALKAAKYCHDPPPSLLLLLVRSQKHLQRFVLYCSRRLHFVLSY